MFPEEAAWHRMNGRVLMRDAQERFAAKRRAAAAEAKQRDAILRKALDAVQRDTGVSATPAQREWCQHIVELASSDPAIEIYWMANGSHTQKFIGAGIAHAFVARRSVVVPPLVTMADYLTSLHELGHCRASNPSRGRLEREEDAWRWAATVAREWGEDEHADMAQSLGGYMKAADRLKGDNSISVLHAERFMSAEGFEEIQQIRRANCERAEDEIFIAKHGAHVRCQARTCRGGVARVEMHSKLLCRSCATDAGVAAARAQVARMRAKRASQPKVTAPPAIVRRYFNGDSQCGRRHLGCQSRARYEVNGQLLCGRCADDEHFAMTNPTREHAELSHARRIQITAIRKTLEEMRAGTRRCACGQRAEVLQADKTWCRRCLEKRTDKSGQVWKPSLAFRERQIKAGMR